MRLAWPVNGRVLLGATQTDSAMQQRSNTPPSAQLPHLHVRHKGARLHGHAKLLALLAQHVAARHHAAALLHITGAHLQERAAEVRQCGNAWF